MTPESAEEHLRVIRSLMERATAYRAVSAPAALGAGLLATLASLAALRGVPPFPSASFIAVWLTVFLVSVALNAFFLWNSARRRGEPFVSTGMKTALASLFPPLLGGAAVTGAAIWSQIQPLPLIGFWMLFYGLALLATMTFAPRSIVLLGWAFLLSGLVLLAALCIRRYDFLHVNQEAAAYWFMGATFGLYHLAYACLIWRFPDSR